jgi:hypothetical protein
MMKYQAGGVSLTHLNCVVTKDDSIEFNIFYDEKHKVLYYADGYDVSKGKPEDFNISAEKITYHQHRIYKDADRTPVSFFDEIDRKTLKFQRTIELDHTQTFQKPRAGDCTIQADN